MPCRHSLWTGRQPAPHQPTARSQLMSAVVQRHTPAGTVVVRPMTTEQVFESALIITEGFLVDPEPPPFSWTRRAPPARRCAPGVNVPACAARTLHTLRRLQALHRLQCNSGQAQLQLCSSSAVDGVGQVSLSVQHTPADLQAELQLTRCRLACRAELARDVERYSEQPELVTEPSVSHAWDPK